MPDVRKTGAWSRAAKLLATTPARLRAAANKALLQEAQFFRMKIVDGIREQAPGGRPLQPLAPTTLAIRRFLGFRGAKALIARGDLRNSIQVIRGRDSVFVGILRTAKGKSGQTLTNVARVHEYGSRPIIVRLTPKARRFLHAAFRKAGLDRPPRSGPSIGIAVMRIPPRPFFAPVFEKFGNDEAAVARRFRERTLKNLANDLWK
jgi:hypothetical protein